MHRLVYKLKCLNCALRMPVPYSTSEKVKYLGIEYDFFVILNWVLA